MYKRLLLGLPIVIGLVISLVTVFFLE